MRETICLLFAHFATAEIPLYLRRNFAVCDFF